MHILALFKRYSTEKCFPGKALKFQTNSTTFSIHLRTSLSGGNSRISMGNLKIRQDSLKALLSAKKLQFLKSTPNDHAIYMDLCHIIIKSKFIYRPYKSL